jgi:hypothetical protein
MKTEVSLQALVDALEMQNSETSAFLDRETGEVHVISHDALRTAEEEDEVSADLHGWEQEELELARRIVDDEDKRYVELPSSWDVDEWSIMQAFSNTLAEVARADCLDAIHGRGAFRAFKRELERHRLRNAWFAFRLTALQNIVIGWCDENAIAFHSSY